jgi:hypothetical protein
MFERIYLYADVIGCLCFIPSRQRHRVYTLL